jgi:Xaa-Pro aminopeptidase
MRAPVLSFAFSSAEYRRRREATLALAADVDADRVLAFGENRSGAAVTYLTGWPVTRLAVCALTASDCSLFVGFHNHVSCARRVAIDAEVRDADDTMIAALVPRTGRVATLGTVPPAVAAAAQEAGVELIRIDAPHARLRTVKSDEEAQALRLGAVASDAGARALIDACVPGATDWDLLAAARDAYTRVGARDHICYIGVTDMTAPDRDVPAQVPEGRTLAHGSVITFELSASVAAEYPGQVLRTVTIGDPTDEFARLHDVAMRARAAIRSEIRAGVDAQSLVRAAGVIDEAGYQTTDDLFHGLGMGYLEPIGSMPSRVPASTPAGTLSAGMALVVQPNVTTADHAAGVQTGEMLLVTDEGFEDIHAIPEGLVTV